MIIVFFIYFVFVIFIVYTIYKVIKDIVALSYKANIEDVQYVYNFSEENKECSICLDEKTNVKLNCGHHFHEDCILVWFQYNASCPVCRIQV